MADATVGTDVPEDATRMSASDAALIREFAGPDAEYFQQRFMRLARNEAGFAELNWRAVLLGPFWGALRSNWLLYWISLIFDTVAIMLIVDEPGGDRCLLGKSQGRMAQSNFYSALAGFVDQG